MRKSLKHIFLLTLAALTPDFLHADQSCQANQICSGSRRAFATTLPKESLCEVGARYRIPCERIWKSPRPHYEEFLKTRDEPVHSEAPYLIEPHTHHIWFAHTKTPQEIPLANLAFFEQSLEFYADHFTHHLWLNTKSLTPKTLERLANFQTPVVIHEISEISEKFITESYFTRFLKHNKIEYATGLAKQEILLQYGGLYVGWEFEQEQDVKPYFKKYNALHFIWKKRELEDEILGASRGANFLKESLNLVNNLASILENMKNPPDPATLMGLPGWHLWRFAWALERKPTTSVGFFHPNEDFTLHDNGLFQKTIRSFKK